jgi:hypothetical protein
LADLAAKLSSLAPADLARLALMLTGGQQSKGIDPGNAKEGP